MLQYNNPSNGLAVNFHYSNRWIDRLGATGSLTCALHCAALPIAIAMLPGLGVSLLASRTIEWIFAVVATLLAALSMWLSNRRHGHVRAKGLLIPGVALLWIGILVPFIHDHMLRHAVLMTGGGVLIALGHLMALRQNHGHIHDATCSH